MLQKIRFKISGCVIQYLYNIKLKQL